MAYHCPASLNSAIISLLKSAKMSEIFLKSGRHTHGCFSMHKRVKIGKMESYHGKHG